MKIQLPFQPPDYDNSAENYRTDLLYSLAWTWIVTTTVLKVIEIAAVPENWVRGDVIIAWIGLASILCLLLNQRKLTRLASIIFPLALWLLLPIIITSGFLSCL
jgi:hypothetical protein